VTGDLDRDTIESALAAIGTRLGCPLTIVEVTGSTNDDAKAAARSGAPAGAAFVADAQTAGRGRLGRLWHSPPGTSLYASFILRPEVPAHRLAPLSLAVGVGVVDAVAGFVARERLGIKWPNDVMLDGRKVSGVLVEAQVVAGRVESVIVGIGVNVTAREFPAELADRATSLAIAGARVARGDVFVALCRSLERRIDSWARDGLTEVMEAVRSLDTLRGRSVMVDAIAGTAIGIDDDGRLLVRLADGTERAHVAGEAVLASA
jgi:BirA family biotin operon repressor/biotin-[acetyl-CoA-carboxylase] ligase